MQDSIIFFNQKYLNALNYIQNTPLKINLEYLNFLLESEALIVLENTYTTKN
jgi:hypothetical protein